MSVAKFQPLILSTFTPLILAGKKSAGSTMQRMVIR